MTEEQEPASPAVEKAMQRFHRKLAEVRTDSHKLGAAEAGMKTYDQWKTTNPADAELRSCWVTCEACGGSGEIVMRSHGAHDPSDEHVELCSACEGTGRDCVDGSTDQQLACGSCGGAMEHQSDNVHLCPRCGSKLLPG